MIFWSRLVLLGMVSAAISCSGSQQPSSPLETFKTYTKSIKAKDTTTMKLLLSNATIRMHQKEAKAQGVTVDDIVKRETLFSENQKSVEFRNEKIDGDKATLEVKNSYGSWEKVPFVREDGVWKIDKVGYADQLMKDIDDSDKKIDEMIKGTSQGNSNVEPPPTATPF